MTPPTLDPSDSFERAIAARRDQWRTRMLLGAVVVVFFSPLVGIAPALAWLGLYAGLQLVEMQLFHPRNSWFPARFRRHALLTLLALNGATFGGFGVMEWYSVYDLGQVCAVLHLCGAVLYLVTTSSDSRPVFTFSAGPHLIFLVSLPIVGFFTGTPFFLAAGVMIAGVTFAVSSIVVWRASARMLASEAEARAAAEAATEAKSAFVAAVSHELRTPLSAIAAGASELARTSENASNRASASLITDAGRMMKRMLDDLLDLAKIEAGRMTVEEAPFDMRRVIHDVARFWRPQALEKGLRLTINAAARTPQWVEGDATRVRQILNNLLSNAIKFTDKGHVRLRVDAFEAEDGAVRTSIVIADTGPGLATDEVARLFAPFQRFAGDRTKEGTGLGLAISRELARLMGGDLTASSFPGMGAMFTLALPLKRAEAVVAEPEAEAAFPPALQGARVLVVDDFEINRRALAALLEPAGCRVAVAASGEDALELLGLENFDVVLMDVHMSGIDGHETTRRLRASPGVNRNVPVIAVTGTSMDDELGQCLDAGMTTTLPKPVEPAALMATVDRMLTAPPAAAPAAQRPAAAG